MYQAAMSGYLSRLKWEHQERMSAAWHGAAFERMKKLPKLESLFTERKPVQAQTPDQMIAVMQSMVKASGQAG